MRVRENLVPLAGLPRAYALVSLIFGVGVGTFITGSTVFFTRVVGLQPHEIGIGLSAAAGAVLVCSVPLSALADRFGPRRAWLFGVAGSAAGFLLWPFARGFFTFLAMIVFFELVNGVAQAGRNVYLIEAVDPETRVRTQAFARSWLNIGWSVGAGMAALALAVDTRAAYLALPLANAAVLLANLVLIARLPAGPAGRVRRRTPGGWGWLLIGGIFLAAGLTAVPLVRWAARHRTPVPAEPAPALT